MSSELSLKKRCNTLRSTSVYFRNPSDMLRSSDIMSRALIRGKFSRERVCSLLLCLRCFLLFLLRSFFVSWETDEVLGEVEDCHECLRTLCLELPCGSELIFMSNLKQRLSRLRESLVELEDGHDVLKDIEELTGEDHKLLLVLRVSTDVTVNVVLPEVRH